MPTSCGGQTVIYITQPRQNQISISFKKKNWEKKVGEKKKDIFDKFSWQKCCFGPYGTVKKNEQKQFFSVYDGRDGHKGIYRTYFIFFSKKKKSQKKG